jgi:hypothetical protein
MTADRPAARRLVACSLASLVGLLLAVAASGGPGKGVDSIGCPPGPSGWNNPPVTKGITAPQTTNNGYGGGYEQVAAGGNVATVTCSYHNTTSKQVYVAVSFALPTDLNPLNDFDLGCSRGDAGWNATERVYRVSSRSEWALATLTDSGRYLQAGEVPAFEGVTRELLRNAKGFGHSCVVAVRPTEVPSRFFFDIKVGGDNLKATFWTPPSPDKSGVFPIEKISPARAKLQVNTSNGMRTLGIAFTKGIDYRIQTGHSPARVRFHVRVTTSHVPACSAGATGQLTIATPIDVAIDVCGRRFTPTVTSFIRIYSD